MKGAIWDVVGGVGCSLLLFGLSLVSWAAVWIVAGLMLMGFAAWGAWKWGS